MSDLEQLTISVAERWGGWTNVRKDVYGVFIGSYDDGKFYGGIPDYANDLNAVREIELKVIDQEYGRMYVHILICLLPSDEKGMTSVVTASSANRCRALMRVAESLDKAK